MQKLQKFGSYLFGAAVACLALATPAGASVAYSVNGGMYLQDFDSLPTSGTSNPWTNDSTLAGWIAVNSLPGGTARSGRDIGTWNAVSIIRAGDGSSNAGAFYSFGTGTSTERALGSIGSGTPGDFAYALVLQNVTGDLLDSFTLKYDGEQWRNGGNADSARHMLDFDFAVFASNPLLTDIQGGNLAGYSMYETSVLGDGSTSNDKVAGTPPLGTPGPLDFPGPVGTTTASALDGNAAANRTPGIMSTQSLAWPNGSYLVLRWWDNNSVGNDHALALDNVMFSATPEPASLSLLLFGGLALLRRRR
jgi:hypothetical protein